MKNEGRKVKKYKQVRQREKKEELINFWSEADY